MTEIFTVKAGNYNVTEDPVANWSLQSSQCTVYDVDGLDQNGEPTNPIINATYTGSQTEDMNLYPWQYAICEFVNNNAVGYFTGGGRVNLDQTDGSPNNANITLVQGYADQKIDQVTHGFELHCDSNSGPNNLEVNWLGTKFHLEQLENALCYDDGTINEPPAQTQGSQNSRKPTLDVYYGEGYGRYDGQCGAYSKWVMDDNGEPGTIDQIVAMVIWNSTGHLVLNINPGNLTVTNTSISGNSTGNPNELILDEGQPWLDLEQGNHQWTPHPFKSHGKTHTVPCDPETVSFDDKQPVQGEFMGWQDPLTYAFPPP
jgi:hypothetical protein